MRLRVTYHCHHGIKHGEARRETQGHKSEEERNSPEVGAGHLDNGQWQGVEADGEAADLLAARIREIPHETDDAVDGEGSDVFKCHIRRHAEKVKESVSEAGRS